MSGPKPKRLKKAYDQPEAGEWVQPVRRGYKLACCDCGLVHLVNFRSKNNRIQFQVYRAKRSTAAIRRKPHRFIPKVHADELAAKLLKITGKKSLRVGDYMIRWKRPT